MRSRLAPPALLPCRGFCPQISAGHASLFSSQPAGVIHGARALRDTDVASDISTVLTGLSPHIRLSRSNAVGVDRKTSGLIVTWAPISMLVVLRSSTGTARPGCHCLWTLFEKGFDLSPQMSAALAVNALSNARARSSAAIGNGRTRCRRSGNSVAATRGERKSARKNSRALREYSLSIGVPRHGCHGTLLIDVLACAANCAAPRLPPDTELMANTCCAKVGHVS